MKILSLILIATNWMAPITVAICAPSALVQAAYGQSSEAQNLVGTWERDGPNDARAHQHVILELRADGTYTKTLDSTVDGNHYGGTHSGTWKSSGMTVYLSGDGNWPASTHDLHEFTKSR